ncbi:uncharacterized protein J3R85_003375 [Psidium guajava]|nr:uncharacterized protein J3R85_003375 [Psidium guajava]
MKEIALEFQALQPMQCDATPKTRIFSFLCLIILGSPLFFSFFKPFFLPFFAIHIIFFFFFGICRLTYSLHNTKYRHLNTSKQTDSTLSNTKIRIELRKNHTIST